MFRRTFLGLISALLWPFGARAVARPPRSLYPGLAYFKFGPWKKCLCWTWENGGECQRRNGQRIYREGTATVVSPIVVKLEWDTLDANVLAAW